MGLCFKFFSFKIQYIEKPMQHTWAPTRVQSTHCAQPSVLGTHSKCFESKILRIKTINLIIELKLTFGVFAFFEDEYSQDDLLRIYRLQISADQRFWGMIKPAGRQRIERVLVGCCNTGDKASRIQTIFNAPYH